ncbi:MAG: photosystem II reaction center protein Psb28 [Xenococcaceae cyanobacterium MO_207.B15]|nr:photosystem II reaction center protein Psb28 [Xenococcaceae cyanobacterium MO_207.B15]MDJ0743521.1 photosystem II reaction center protein Psb28 [Xenococcaceae cyanobacterium MO_167.B27]
MAEIQFSRGIKEEVVPDIRVTRSRNADGGIATFYFDSPQALNDDSTVEITGMYLVDDEGEIITRDVKGKFINGKPSAIEAKLLMNSAGEWERFIRFMDKYAEENGLGLTKS